MWNLEMKEYGSYTAILNFTFETLEKACEFIGKASENTCEELEFKLWKVGE